MSHHLHHQQGSHRQLFWAAPIFFINHIERTNTMRVEPYLMFSGHCEEALVFYQTAVGKSSCLWKKPFGRLVLACAPTNSV
jgi:hypothetical protein